MEINRNNYEAYFIDYLDGNLDESLVDRFIEFLQENPDMKEELKLFKSISVIPEEITFQPKNKLYKSKYDIEEEFNMAAVAEIEGDLEEEETAAFTEYLDAHPEKQKDHWLFEKTILTADENIRFARKDRLYKKPVRKVVLLWAGRVAAILVLGLAIFSLIDRTSTTNDQENQAAQTDLPEKISHPDIPPRELQITEPEKTEPLAVVVKMKQIRNQNKSPEHTIEQGNLTVERIPLEVPKKLTALTASLDAGSPHASLGTVTLVYSIDDDADDEHLLTDNLRDKISLQKITRAGLNLVTSLSNERFTYQTNKKGKVIEYNFDSRLLAFSIPAASHNTDDK